jgi:replicative DNA helicase
MISSQIGQRLLSDASGVNGMRLRAPQYIQPDDWEALSKGMNDFSALPMQFLFERNVEEICAQVRAQHSRGLCDFLVVDYMQLLTTHERIRDDWLRVGHISQMLKALTTDLKIPVIGLAQVARQNGVATVPKLDSLRGSGNLEQDADNVILLHRVESRDDDALTDDERMVFEQCVGKGYNLMILNVAKQRQGRVGLVSCIFDPAHMRYAPVRG